MWFSNVESNFWTIHQCHLRPCTKTMFRPFTIFRVVFFCLFACALVHNITFSRWMFTYKWIWASFIVHKHLTCACCFSFVRFSIHRSIHHSRMFARNFELFIFFGFCSWSSSFESPGLPVLESICSVSSRRANTCRKKIEKFNWNCFRFV